MKLARITAAPAPIPLREPFAISRATVDSTRAVLVRATVEHLGRRAHGYGEAALALDATQPLEELARSIEATGVSLAGTEIEDLDTLGSLVDEAYDGTRPGRSAHHVALLDASARLQGIPLYRALGGASALPLITDITLPIGAPARRADLATTYWGQGFRCFKLKVGADLAQDVATLEHLAAATPGARLVLDANEGFSAEEALELLRRLEPLDLRVDCFEQPCPRDALDALRAVKEGTEVPVVADESLASLDDLVRLVAAEAVDGVNLKLVKIGGIDRCLAIGRAAQEQGLALMVGAMIESRLGLSAMAHLACALGGVRWVDLDTAFLLQDDPFVGGMEAGRPDPDPPRGSGLGIAPR